VGGIPPLKNILKNIPKKTCNCVIHPLESVHALRINTQKDKIMTVSKLLTAIQKHFATPYDLQVAVSDHRAGHPEWNWVDAASDLLDQLEGK
jgi:hypothetical protein